MLVLSRFKSDEVVIEVGDVQIVVMVVEARSDGKVRLGFTAPPEVVINRREVFDAIQRERKESA